MRVGFLMPPGYFSTAYLDFLKVAPRGTEVMTTFIPIALDGQTMGSLSLDTIRGAVDAMGQAARTFMLAGADVVAQFGCPYTLVHGAGARDVQRGLTDAAGVPVVTMGAAMLDALGALGARRVAVAAGYYTEPAWVAMACSAIEGAGFEIVYVEDWIQQGVVASVVESDRLAWECEPKYAVATTVEAARRSPDADTVVVFGGGVRMVDCIDEAERQAGKPIVAGDIALFWATLKAGGQQPVSAGTGQLLGSL